MALIQQPFDPLANPDRTVELNWYAYFKRFCEVHGEPVEFAGRLLFPDGYQYSNSDYAGPEWVPPSDPEKLSDLRRIYWQRRLQVVKERYKWLKAELEELAGVQYSRSAPLQRTAMYWDDSRQQLVFEPHDVDLELLRGDLLGLQEDMKLCEEELANASPGKRLTR